MDNRALYFSALSSPEELCTIAIDYEELKRLSDAAKDAGFDPYTQYMKIMAAERARDKRRHKREEVDEEEQIRELFKNNIRMEEISRIIKGGGGEKMGGTEVKNKEGRRRT